MHVLPILLVEIAPSVVEIDDFIECAESTSMEVWGRHLYVSKRWSFVQAFGNYDFISIDGHGGWLADYSPVNIGTESAQQTSFGEWVPKGIGVSYGDVFKCWPYSKIVEACVVDESAFSTESHWFNTKVCDVVYRCRGEFRTAVAVCTFCFGEKQEQALALQGSHCGGIPGSESIVGGLIRYQCCLVELHS